MDGMKYQKGGDASFEEAPSLSLKKRGRSQREAAKEAKTDLLSRCEAGKREFFASTRAQSSSAFFALKRKLSSRDAAKPHTLATGARQTAAALALPVYTPHGQWAQREDAAGETTAKPLDVSASLRGPKVAKLEKSRRKRQEESVHDDGGPPTARYLKKQKTEEPSVSASPSPSSSSAPSSVSRSGYQPLFEVSEAAWKAVRHCRSLAERRRELASLCSSILASPENHMKDFEVVFAFFFHAKKRLLDVSATLASLSRERAGLLRRLDSGSDASAVGRLRDVAEKRRFLRSTATECAYVASAALLSLGALLKDVLPGYKLGLGGEDEEKAERRDGGSGAFLTGKAALKTVRLSKEVEKLRAFEAQLLEVYRRSVRLIEAEIHAALAADSASRRGLRCSWEEAAGRDDEVRGGRADAAEEASTAPHPEAASSLATSAQLLHAAATALCELVRARPKFNDGDRLLSLCVYLGGAASRRDPEDDAEADDDATRLRRTVRRSALSCCACLRELVSEDASLEVVLAIASEVSSQLDQAAKRSGREGRDAGLSAPLLDIFLSLRLREKEVEALRGDDRLPEKADKQLKDHLRLAFVHTEKKLFKKREAALLERLFIIFLRILKSLDRQPPSLVTAAFRGLVCFASHINTELLSEILVLFQELLLQPCATASEQLSSVLSSSSSFSAGDKKRKKAKKPLEEEEARVLSPHLQKYPELAAAAIATPLLLLQRVQTVLQLDVSWLARALCDLIVSSVAQFAAGAAPHSAAPSSGFLATSSLLQPFTHDAAAPSSFAACSAPSAFLEPEFAGRCLDCLDLFLKAPQLWGPKDEQTAAERSARSRATAKGHAAVLRDEDDLEFSSRGRSSSALHRECVDGALEALRELVRVAALGDLFIADAVLARVHRLLADTPRLQSAVESEGIVLKGGSASLSLHFPLCLLASHLHPEVRSTASRCLRLSTEGEVVAHLRSRESQVFLSASSRPFSASFHSSALGPDFEALCESDEAAPEAELREREARSRTFVEQQREHQKDAQRECRDARRQRGVCTAEDFSAFCARDDSAFLAFLFDSTPDPSLFASPRKKRKEAKEKDSEEDCASTLLHSLGRASEKQKKRKKRRKKEKDVESRGADAESERDGDGTRAEKREERKETEQGTNGGGPQRDGEQASVYAGHCAISASPKKKKKKKKKKGDAVGDGSQSRARIHQVANAEEQSGSSASGDPPSPKERQSPEEAEEGRKAEVEQAGELGEGLEGDRGAGEAASVSPCAAASGPSPWNAGAAYFESQRAEEETFQAVREEREKQKAAKDAELDSRENGETMNSRRRESEPSAHGEVRGTHATVEGADARGERRSSLSMPDASVGLDKALIEEERGRTSAENDMEAQEKTAADACQDGNSRQSVHTRWGTCESLSREAERSAEEAKTSQATTVKSMNNEAVNGEREQHRGDGHRARESDGSCKRTRPANEKADKSEEQKARQDAPQTVSAPTEPASHAEPSSSPEASSLSSSPSSSSSSVEASSSSSSSVEASSSATVEASCGDERSAVVETVIPGRASLPSVGPGLLSPVAVAAVSRLSVASSASSSSASGPRFSSCLSSSLSASPVFCSPSASPSSFFASSRHGALDAVSLSTDASFSAALCASSSALSSERLSSSSLSSQPPLASAGAPFSRARACSSPPSASSQPSVASPSSSSSTSSSSASSSSSPQLISRKPVSRASFSGPAPLAEVSGHPGAASGEEAGKKRASS
ncbi:hypothetical protein TGGT1_218070 [Toxoplasma gondii GT1]|uniref:Nucleolar complex-associated protein 3 N-terminal domain-containing protein n=4 Tax=Toxoplasma gondii TaxID=5811 RepID=S7V1Z3_TOXGG|nr:hypothetical protein TGGT1_218070 [Toxoplasma gondii GT1]KAF4638314.1 hypothetical protein TGRH88_059210 [Toxoplasma gondii]